MAYLELDNLKKIYDEQEAVKNISMNVAKGQFVALVGPSGCGKTTTLRLLTGLIYPDSGKIVIDDKDVTNISTEKRDIVMVFQDPLLFPHMTIEQNIGFGLKMQGKPKVTIKNKVQEMLELIQLEGLENRYPDQISGGQRQRVALARALSLEPKVLVLDEPFSSLDPSLRGEMRELILKIHKKLKMTTICVTHDSEEAMHLADLIAVIFDGQIVQFAPPEEVYQKPENWRVAEFFGRCNIFECEVINNTVFWNEGNGQVKGLGNGSYTAFLRPENIQVSKTNDQQGFIQGKFIREIFSGEKSIYYCDIKGKTVIAYGNQKLKLKENDDIYLYIDWDKSYLKKEV